ncbi:MAG: ParA family protein [Nanoarchaeota archaeon]|nr:ParA family protein [Nanoarchaeota archaeon]MBU1644388.1 ParA family protein [Nanoarchaeota archaeon]MBU1976425.1 ParA family protein [Nanoarchaeota archaeon]
MRTICVINQKGGVGKTTTAVNLAAGLSRSNKRVLLIDLDPQGNVFTSLKIRQQYDMYDALVGRQNILNCISTVAKNFDVITSKETLVKAEYYLATQDNSRMLLKNLLSKINNYDYILVDCPPSLGLLNQNAMAFCKEAFIPSSTDPLGYDALKKMGAIVNEINNTYNHDIKITKIVPTLFDKRNKICKEILVEMKEEFSRLVSTPIRMNSKVKEAPKYGKSIFSYAKSSPGAKDYGKLVEEVLDMGSIRVVQEMIA